MNAISLGLLIVGVLTAAAGIAVMVLGGRGEAAPAPVEYNDWATGGASRSRPGLVVGALVTTLGVVLAATGAVTWVLRPGAAPEEMASPIPTTDTTTLLPAPEWTEPAVPSPDDDADRVADRDDAGGADRDADSGADSGADSDADRGAGSGSGSGGDRGDDRGSGDLGLTVPISRPSCDGRGIVVLYSAVTPGAYASEIGAALAANPGAKYLRTDESCPSLRARDDNGNVIYAVYLESGYTRSEVCADVAIAPAGAYGRWLDLTSDPSVLVTC